MHLTSASLLDVERVTVTCVGDGAVGKTSLLLSYVSNKPPPEYAPTVFDCISVNVSVDQRVVQVALNDTAGQEDYDALRPLAYPSTDVFVLCYAVNSPTSLANVRSKWLPELRHHKRDAPIVLVGLKKDLASDESVPLSAAQDLADEFGLACAVEASALLGENVKTVFDEAIVCALDKRNPSKQANAKKRFRNKNCNIL